MRTVEVPAGLAAMAAGAELAAALHAVPLPRVPNDRMLDVLTAQYRQLCHEQARMMAVLAEVGRCTGMPVSGQVSRADAPDRFASAETRAALRWTRQAADTEHDLAESVVHGMPQLFAAWLAGTIDRPRVRVFDQYLTGLTPEQVEGICQVAVPRAPTLTTGQLARLLRRMVIAVDPDAAARWYRRGVRDRNVTAYPAPDGTITVSANGLPADEAEAACERIQQLAAAAKRAGHPGLIGQIRCDLFLGLLDGRFHGMTTEQVITALIAQYRPTGPAGDAPAGSCPPRRPGPADGQQSGGSRSAGTDDGDTHDNRHDDDRHDDDRHDDDRHDDDRHDDRHDDRPGDGDPGDGDPDDGDLDDDDPDGSGPGDGGPGGGPRTGPVGPGATGSGSDQRVGIEIRVGLATLLGRDEFPAEIPGLGLLIAPDARLRVALQGRAEWRFAVTDAAGTLISEGRTGRRPAGVRRDGPPGGIVELHVPAALLHELAAGLHPCGAWAAVVADIAAQHAERERHLADLDAHPGDRLPGAALRRHTEIRDRTCTFAGVCRRPAHASEQDHSHDHARGGVTERINLGPLCDHDHLVKHRAGWRVTQPEPGTFVWRSPLGGEYTTRGEFLMPELPEPAPSDPPPWPDGPSRTVEGSILRRPRPPPPPPPPAPPVEYPDEPPF